MRYEDASHSGAFQGQGPIANDDLEIVAAGSKSSATGNLITGDGTQTGATGADSAAGAHITAIAGKGGEDTSFSGGKLSVDGEYGKLMVDAEGNYVYQANKGVENVRDRFTYTLADNQGATDNAVLIVEIGKTPFAIKADAQQIVPGPDGVVTLPPGVELSDVHVVGRNLVIDMPDGTQLIIIDGAVFVPQLVLGGVEIPATNVAALLVGQEIAPAAGETPPSSGGNFAVPPPPLDPGVPLGDLIPPTEYGYTPPDVEEIGQILDRDPEAGAATAILDDDAQAGGIAGGVGDDPGTNFDSGVLPGSGGDGSLEWNLLASGSLPAGFSFAPQGNGDMWIMQGGVHVLTVTVNPDTGAFTVTQVAAIDHPAGGDENNLDFVINYSVTDDDGDVAVGTLTINADDDTPTIDVTVASDANVVLLTQDAQTDGDPTDTDTATTTANFGGIFGASSAYGADGAGTTSLTYALSTTGGAANLSSHGVAINLYNINGVIVGSTAATVGAVNASNTIFDVSVDANTGVVTLHQYAQIDHPLAQDPTPPGPGYEDQLATLADGAITLTRTGSITDGDGDTATDSASVGIGANIKFADDGPSIDPTLNEVGGAVVDESVPVHPATIPLVGGFTRGDDPHLSGDLAIGKGSTSGPVIDANAAFGADGPASGGGISYALDVLNLVSGLTTTEGVAINLVELANGVVVGVVNGTTTVAFAIQIDANTGVVTVEQYLSIFHPDSPNNFDEPVFLNEGSLGVTVTATDFDGDSVTSDAVDITSLIRFEDDGPSIDPVLNANATVTVDESLPSDAPGINTGAIVKGDDPDLAGGLALGQGNSGVAIVNANAVFGADGPAAQGSIVYSLSITNPDPGVTLTDGTTITMTLVNGVIVGVVDSGPFDGQAAFAISINPATGVVTVEQYLSLDHPVNPNPNDPLGLGDNSVAVNVTATDGDGDHITSGDIDISGQITFLDDGPSVAPTLNVQATVTVDESLPSNAAGINTGGIVKGDDPDLAGGLAIGQANSGSAIVNANAVFGADGPAAGGGISYALSILNVSSGLTLTDGTPVSLQLVGGVIVGVVNGGAFNGQAAFAIAINSSTGVVTMEQYLSLDHPINPNPNDPLSFASNIIGVTVTATDGDGDPVTSPAVDIGGQLTFLDDGPSANNDTDVTNPATDTAVGNVITGVGTNEGAGNADVPGADGFGAISNLVGFGGSTDSNPVGGFDVNGQWGTLHMDANGQYTYTRTGGAGGATDSFTYTYLDGDGDPATATLVITIADTTPTLPDPDLVRLDDDVIPGANGILNGPGDDDPDTVPGNVVNGQLNGSGGDGDLDYFFTGLNTLPAGFTVNAAGLPGSVQVLQGATVVLTITLNNETGAFTVTQNNPILHPADNGGPDDNIENNLLFSIGVEVRDLDNDAEPATITINVDDDSPVAAVVTTGQNVSVDETNGNQGDSNDVTGPLAVFAGVANKGTDADMAGPQFGTSAAAVVAATGSAYGADGAGTTVFGLSVAPGGVDSGLDTTAGVNIFLFLEGGLVVGRVGATAGAAAAGPAAFALSIDPSTGFISMVEYMSINHPNTGNPDDSVSILNAAVQATVTVTDSDGDQQSNSVNIGSQIQFQDDGPTAGIVTTGQTVSLDETAANQGDSNDVTGPLAAFAGVANVGDDPDVAGTGPIQFATNASALVASTGSAYGADGAGTTVFSLNIPSAGVDSGLNVTGGQDILLFKEGNLIVGRVSGGPFNGQAAFALSIDPSTGAVSMVEYLSIQHPTNPNPDESVSITNTSVQATVTVTDGDGDSASQSTNIGSLISFQDDGPTAAIVTTGQTVSLDETLANQGDSNDVTGPLAAFAGVANVGDDPDVAGTGPIQFATNASALVASTGSAYGADGPGTTVFSFSVAPGGVDSGLDTTAGVNIFLFLEGGLVVGRVGATAGVAAGGPAAFALAIDPSTGAVSMVEYLSINHPNTGNPDDSVSILNTAVQATVTVTDGDGDTASNSVNIGSLIQFQDDGPTLGSVQSQQTDNNPATTPAVGTLHFAPGVDGAGSTMTITADVTGIKSGGFNLVTQQVGNVLTAYQDTNGDGIHQGGEATAVFTITVNPSAGTSGQYVFDLITPLDVTVVDTPIGSSSSFGAGPTLGQQLLDAGGTTTLSVVSGYHPTGSFNSTTWFTTGVLNTADVTAAGVNGSTSGWGVDNNNFENPDEIMFFDFGNQALADPDGGGAYTPPAATLPDITFAKFDFIHYSSGAGDAGDDIAYVVHFTDGSFASGWVPDVNIDGTTWVLNAPAGKFIADVQFFSGREPSGAVQDLAAGKIDLVSVGVTTTSIDKTINATVQLTDGDGDPTGTGAFSIHVATGLVPFAPAAPVVLDLNGDGVHFLAADAGVTYDYGHGAVATAWAGPDDGILIHDANGNGTVDGASEFVFGSGSVTDLQGLRALYGDTLDANDADFAHFGVWQDANSNGVVDAGEFASLTAKGITSINLTSDGQAYSAAGGDVFVAGSSTYTNSDGSTGAVADASFLTGRMADDGRALNTSSSSLAIAAAVAAAGLANSQAAANGPADQGHEAASVAAGAGAPVTQVTEADANDDGRSALSNESKVVANDDAPASSSHASTEAGSSHSLDDSQSSTSASSSDHAAAGNDQGPAAAVASASAPTVAMVSAEALQAAAGLDGNAQHNSVVEKVVAEALGQGNSHGAIDTLLDAFHGGNGGGAAIANLASGAANGVPAWDMASDGGSSGNFEVLMKVGAQMLHHDMVQPTHNG